MKKTKFIFITGGVYSSLGKGITASSIGRILKEMGFIVAMQKLDPYLNVDPENISPYQHGEVFVTNDGAKADLDLGNYERFTDHNLNKYSTITSGRIYQEVLQNERDGKYNGKTVQVLPHVTNQIISKLHLLAKTNKADFAIVEIGGTVGDLESLSLEGDYLALLFSMGFQPTLKIPLSIDFKWKGYVLDRKGISADVSINYKF